MESMWVFTTGRSVVRIAALYRLELNGILEFSKAVFFPGFLDCSHKLLLNIAEILKRIKY